MPVAVAVTLAGCRARGPESPATVPDGAQLAEAEAELDRLVVALSAEGVLPAVASLPRLAPLGGDAASDAAAANLASSADEGAQAGALPMEDAELDDRAEEAESVAPAPPPPEPARATAQAAPARDRTERLKSAAKREQAPTARAARVCGLAQATCDLADRICTLARSHPGEPPYEVACERARAQCEVAADACADAGG